jgi:hypothetical protein
MVNPSWHSNIESSQQLNTPECGAEKKYQWSLSLMKTCTTVYNKEKLMNNERFNNIVQTQLGQIESMLVSKGTEYATDRDRLHNFKQAAALQKLSPRDALAGMMIKHTVSIYDMIGDQTGTHAVEKWDEKITDHLTYLVLLKAVIDEEFEDAKAAAKDAGYPSAEAQAATLARRELEERFISNVKFNEAPTELLTTTVPA